jgi:hypothetical protein
MLLLHMQIRRYFNKLCDDIEFNRHLFCRFCVLLHVEFGVYQTILGEAQKCGGVERLMRSQSS